METALVLEQQQEAALSPLPGLLQALPKCASSCSRVGLFRTACQVPGCLLCVSVCVITDRDWIRDGSVVTVRWKYHTLPLPSHPPSRLQLNGHCATSEENFGVIS